MCLPGICSKLERIRTRWKKIYSLLRRESPHRAAKTVALAQIHEENMDEKIKEEHDREEERST